MLPATMRVIPKSPRARQKASTMPAVIERHASGLPVSIGRAVAITDTCADSATGNTSMRSELSGEEKPVALHDRAPLRAVHELDEGQPQLGTATLAYDGHGLVERRVQRAVDEHVVDDGDAGQAQGDQTALA